MYMSLKVIIIIKKHINIFKDISKVTKKVTMKTIGMSKRTIINTSDLRLIYILHYINLKKLNIIVL